MRKFTLDTNCILALDENRPEAKSMRALIDAHYSGRALVAVVAISASERQRDGSHLANFGDFQRRLAALNMGHLEILHPMAYLDIGYLDWSVLSDPAMEALERRVHEVLFPGIEFEWGAYCAARSMSVDETGTDKKWRNAKCDVQAMWCHIHGRRDVFVTSDRNFHSPARKSALVALGAGRIEFPEDAARLLAA